MPLETAVVWDGAWALVNFTSSPGISKEQQGWRSAELPGQQILSLFLSYPILKLLFVEFISRRSQFVECSREMPVSVALSLLSGCY